MTPGEEALREAMRLEQARIYGQPQREHRNLRTELPEVSGEHATLHDIEAARLRKGVA